MADDRHRRRHRGRCVPQGQQAGGRLLYAVISSGHADAADLFMLVAFILAAIATVLTALKGSVEGALVPAAVAFLALGLLVL